MRTALTLAVVALLAAPALADSKADKDPVKCMIVHVGSKDVSPPIEVNYLKGQAHPDKIPAKSAEILCKNTAAKPAADWARDNDACAGNAPKMTLKWGKVSAPQTIETNVGLSCKPKKH
jgi:hypothetical protein